MNDAKKQTRNQGEWAAKQIDVRCGGGFSALGAPDGGEEVPGVTPAADDVLTNALE